MELKGKRGREELLATHAVIQIIQDIVFLLQLLLFDNLQEEVLQPR